MEAFKMTNLWVFNEYLTTEIQEKVNARELSKDPYEQMTIDSEKRILEKTLMKYKELIVNQNR